MAAPTSLQQSITMLKGVGPKLAEHLERIHIVTIQDLLFHLPLRYEDRTRISTINEARPGDRVLIEGVIQSAAIAGKRRANLACRLEDDTGAITLRFFHFNKWQREKLTEGTWLRCFGEVRANFHGALEMMHPEYRDKSRVDELAVTDTLTPIYPATKGLQQATLRKLVAQAITLLTADAACVELLPNEILEQFSLPSITQALLFMHNPPADTNLAQIVEGKHPAQHRLAFEELLAHQLSLQKLRYDIREQPALNLTCANTLAQQLRASLPFQLTSAQQRVLEEINADTQTGTPMLRLVQGDVGCGKTIVAALAMLSAVELGYQATMMAPTELLVEQHWRNLSSWLEPLGVTLVCLTGRTAGKARTEILEQIANGQAQVVVGTHALFQADIEFQKLALLVIDEQHRFGVGQRLALKEKGAFDGLQPHQLIMTATPIPRTLAMTAYSDLDVSVIDELPPGRTPVNTILVPAERREQLIARVQANCQEKKQAYWVCTLIAESEALQCQAAENTAQELATLLPELKIGLVHGRQKADEKEAIMRAFKNADIDLLVATTVIEVGVDVPNASLMIIENPERLGLSQLHQLRGRVGRGSTESHCVLLYKGPLSKMAQERLSEMRATTDGFAIAQKDLEMRGPGEVLGTRQAGLIRFRVADLARDSALLPDTQLASQLLVQNHPSCIEPLTHRWLSGALEFAQV